MTGHFILADMTSHRRGFGVQLMLNAAARRAQTNHSFNKVLWLVPSYLTLAFDAHGIGNTAEIRNCDTIGAPHWIVIQSEIERIHSTVPGAEITVVTWDPFIYEKARGHGHGVIGKKWFDWISDDRASLMARTPLAPQHRIAPMGGPLPTAEQLQEIILTYLKKIGATSQQRAIYRSQLRPALMRNGVELRTASYHPYFASSFKMALDTAVNSKQIGEDRWSPGKERIWAIESDSVTATPSVASPAPNTAGPAQAIPVPSGDGAATKTTTAPTYQRSAQFRKRLTDLGIFCEKRERDVLLQATEQLLKTGPTVLSKLRRELPKAAKQLASEHNLCPGTEFRRIVNFFLKLLLVSGALTSDGGTIKRDASAEATTVTGLVEGPMNIMESYLVEQILKKSDVKDREHWQLALAVFREFDSSVSIDDKLDRVASLISGLSDRVILTDDGTYEYTGRLTGVRAIRAQA
jgi:hypothetical protein